jgi:NAD(P)-dependent dehydrogenase (short-subunit alcohol dehydrogenase family)
MELTAVVTGAARGIVFLAAPEPGGITGTILSVDGGYVAR